MTNSLLESLFEVGAPKLRDHWEQIQKNVELCCSWANSLWDCPSVLARRVKMTRASPSHAR